MVSTSGWKTPGLGDLGKSSTEMKTKTPPRVFFVCPHHLKLAMTLLERIPLAQECPILATLKPMDWGILGVEVHVLKLPNLDTPGLANSEQAL